MTTLELKALYKNYGAVRALDGVDLLVQPGSRTAIVGPSGSGKTSLLRVIAGFEVPDAGRVTLGGQLLADGPEAVPAHRRGIGYVPQDGALFPHLSVADNVGFGLARNDPQRSQRIAELMDMVSLDAAMLQRRPHELSGGQQQRVALARALALRPRLMLLDEPFSALDTGLRAATRKAVAQLLQSAGITTILVTHDQSEALSFADQVAVMRHGRLAQVGSPTELVPAPGRCGDRQFPGRSHRLAGNADGGLGRLRTGPRRHARNTPLWRSAHHAAARATATVPVAGRHCAAGPCTWRLRDSTGSGLLRPCQRAVCTSVGGCRSAPAIGAQQRRPALGAGRHGANFGAGRGPCFYRGNRPSLT